MDVAASEFYKGGKYDLDFKSPDDPSRYISPDQLADLYRSFVKDYPGQLPWSLVLLCVRVWYSTVILSWPVTTSLCRPEDKFCDKLVYRLTLTNFNIEKYELLVKDLMLTYVKPYVKCYQKHTFYLPKYVYPNTNSSLMHVGYL